MALKTSYYISIYYSFLFTGFYYSVLLLQRLIIAVSLQFYYHFMTIMTT